MRETLIVVLGLVATSGALAAGPHPAMSGISAAADNASVAGSNPAGMTRFDSRVMRGEILGFFSDNTWEGQLGDTGPEFRSEDSSTTVVPSGNMVMPFKDNWWFGFTILGSGFSDEFADDWPGRYFIEEYQLLYISAFPSIATKLTDELSVAGSLAITYTSYEQDKAVPNLDPGAGDGHLNIDTDGFTVGFAISGLYEFTERTRFGMSYRSELDAELDGTAKFSDLSPTTEAVLDAAGLLNARVDVTSRSPQSIIAGIYHEFADTGAVTFDVAWTDFSEFKLSEIYVNGDQLLESNPIYDDIFAFSVGYSRPLSDRLRIGFGGLYADDMIEDENRTITLRLDSMWAVGVGIEWQWTDKRAITATLNYLKMGDAPVTSPDIPLIGSVTGRYTDRQTIWLQVGMNIGTGGR
jgi:long-chain fatty acid transport protein